MNIYFRKLKPLCIGGTWVRLIAIPVMLLSAHLLSDITAGATAGDVPAVLTKAALLFLVMTVFLGFRTWTDTLLARRREQALAQCRMHLLRQILQGKLPRLFRTDSGTLLEHLNDDLDAVTKRYTEHIPALVTSLLSAAAYLTALLLQSPVIAGSLLLISLLQLLPPLIVKKYLQVNYEACREMEARLTDHISQAVQGFDTVKLYDLKGWWLTGTEALHREYLKVGNRSTAAATAQQTVNSAVDNILRFGSYALMGMLVLKGVCTLAVVVQAIYLSSDLFSAVKGVFSAIPRFALASTAEKRLAPWMAAEPVSHGDRNDPYIRLQQVSCATEDKTLFDRLDLTLDPRENYVLTGENGSGKSTLLGLICGLIVPEQGRVEAPDDLFYIPQKDMALHLTPKELFAMFAERQAGIARTAAAFGLQEEHLNRQICDLSGGERKKVMLSVGLSLPYAWLLLDEPTNSLDAHSKQVLWELLEKRTGTLVVSHDPVITERASRVLTLKGGAVA